MHSRSSVPKQRRSGETCDHRPPRCPVRFDQGRNREQHPASPAGSGLEVSGARKRKLQDDRFIEVGPKAANSATGAQIFDGYSGARRVTLNDTGPAARAVAVGPLDDDVITLAKCTEQLANGTVRDVGRGPPSSRRGKFLLRDNWRCARSWFGPLFRRDEWGLCDTAFGCGWCAATGRGSGVARAAVAGFLVVRGRIGAGNFVGGRGAGGGGCRAAVGASGTRSVVRGRGCSGVWRS